MHEQNFSKDNKEKTTGEKFMENDILVAGKKIRLVKVYGDNESIEGILDANLKLGKPINMDTGLIITDPIIDVQLSDDKIFLKTSNCLYELVPPTDAIKKTELNSEELIEIGKEIDDKLKNAQASALNKKEFLDLFNKKQDLDTVPNKTLEIKNHIKEIEKKLEGSKVVVDNILEFKILMEKTGKNYYIIRNTIEHENAHSNKASSLDTIYGGYSISVFKNEKGGYSYQPTARAKIPEEWDDRKKIEYSIKIARAPEEYGNRMSAGDIEKVKKLQVQLEDLNKNYNKL